MIIKKTFNFHTIMSIPLLSKLFGFILEKKIDLWIESEGRRDKGQAGFRTHHSTMNHLITLWIIAEEFLKINPISFATLRTLGNLSI